MADSTSEEHAGWERRLGRVADAASQWQQTMGREPIAVEPGSDLAGDDARFMGFNDSNLVGHSLATATEHLDFILSVMKQTSTRYPTPRS